MCFILISPLSTHLPLIPRYQCRHHSFLPPNFHCPSLLHPLRRLISCHNPIFLHLPICLHPQLFIRRPQRHQFITPISHNPFQFHFHQHPNFILRTQPRSRIRILQLFLFLIHLTIHFHPRSLSNPPILSMSPLPHQRFPATRRRTPLTLSFHHISLPTSSKTILRLAAFLNYRFPNSTAIILACGAAVARNILLCMALKNPCGLACLNTILRA